MVIYHFVWCVVICHSAVCVLASFSATVAVSLSLALNQSTVFAGVPAVLSAKGPRVKKYKYFCVNKFKQESILKTILLVSDHMKLTGNHTTSPYCELHSIQFPPFP